MTLFLNSIWPPIAAAVEAICSDLDGPLLQQLDQLEDRVSAGVLERRIAAKVPLPELRLHDFADKFAQAFHDISAEWISGMFMLEQTARDILEQPCSRIIDPGGAIPLAEANGPDMAAPALQKSGTTSWS